MADDDEMPVKPCKVTLIGETAVGKTSIISRFYKDTFDPNCISSLGASFVSKKMNFKENNVCVRFDIWDTAGQEKYRSLAKIFYKDTQILIFVYDITKRDTFDAIKNFWYPQVQENTKNPPIFALAANKSDLYAQEEVTEQEALEYADGIQAIFKTTSALSNQGIDSIFSACGKKFLNPTYDYQEEERELREKYEAEKEKEEEEKKIDLRKPKNKKKKKDCNC